MTKKPASKIFSIILTVALLVGAGVTNGPLVTTAYAAMPTSAAGDAWDGVDFAALEDGGIYYGTYDHATSLENGSYGTATKEGTATPILWRVMGEEETSGVGDGNITLMSEYVLDTYNFHSTYNAGDNYYNDSAIRTWLNVTFLNSFETAEQVGMSATDVVTGMYDYKTGAEQTDSSLPWTAENDKVYLPWGKDHDESVYWTAGNDVTEGKLSNSYSDNIGKLKNGPSVFWWLRSPGSINSDIALDVYSDGGVNRDDVTNALGVRPAFKLNPESVIFTSEILSSSTTPQYTGQAWVTEADGTNYAAATAAAAKNFKLTVVDSSLSLTGLQDGDSNNITSATTLTATPGGIVALTGTGTGGTNLTYKIVADNGGTREIVGYGQSADNTSLTIDAKDLGGTNLADGDYTVYVWAQKNNTINSHEGSVPQYFTLDVQTPDTTAPTISTVTPSGTGVDINGNIAITFSESMNTSVGTVSLDGGTTTLTGSWSVNDTVYTASYTGLVWNMPYTITIAGFEDAASNAADLGGATYSFTTKEQPTGPDVSPTTLNLDLNGNATGTLTVSLGQSGNQAAMAGVTVDPANTSDISVSTDSLSADGTVTVTGLQVVSGAGIMVEFSGGLATPTSIPVTVNVTDSTPPPQTQYTVTFNLAGGTRTGGGALSQTIPHGGTATAPTVTRSDYTFSGWDKDFSSVTADMTVTARWTYNGGSYTGGDSSSDSYTPPVIWNIVTDKQPNLPKTATLSHSGAVKNNRLTCTITKEMVQAALDKAGKNPDGIGLIFNITGSGFTAQTITFEDAAIDLLKSSGVKFVQVNTGIFRFKFDDKAIAQLDAQTTGPVSVNANPAKLNAEAKKLIGSRPAFDVTVQFKKDGKTRNVVSLGSGKMTRWIEYKPAAGENAGNLAAVYVDKNGKASWIDGSAYDNGWLGWMGNTCSVYGVGYKTPAPAFTDTANHWGKDSIGFAVSRGYMSGTSATTFSPDTIITRGMFITALGRLSGADMSGYKTSSFSDVASDSYYLPYIEWAVANKVVNGVGGGRFAPESPIAREDMAVMMANFAKALNYKLPVALEAFKFTDAGSIASHAKEAVTAVQQAGIVVGKSGGVFDPKGNLTRAEACTVLRRFVETVIDPASARGWAQNDSGQWMYYGLTSGKLTTGWQTIGGEKYYFDTNGAMQADKWVQIEGKRYYFYPDGTLAVNTTIDGYEVGADGARK